MQTQVIQGAEQVSVTNYFYNKNHHMPWISAILNACTGSVHVYGRRLELLAYNNRWGTLSMASESDRANVHTVFAYLSQFYVDTQPAIMAILTAHRHHTPGNFTLQMLPSRRLINSRAWPVVIDGKIEGVVAASGFDDGETGDQRQ